jgi:ferredoxin
MNPFFAKFRQTEYIRLNPRECEGCWECIAACPPQILIAAKHGPHLHVHVADAEACTGCRKCVRVCEPGAIKYIYLSKPKQAEGERPALRQ